jgi:hypothetical protein
MLRDQAAELPRVQAVLVEELARSVLAGEAVRLAAAILREQNADARLTLALRLCAVVDRGRVGPLPAVDGRRGRVS